MPHAKFLELNEQKMEEGQPIWANPRNAAAGSLKLLNPREAAGRGLSIVFYGVGEDSSGSLSKQSQVAPFLHALGLPVLEYTAYCSSVEDIWAFAEKIRLLRPSLSYDIDGIVIKLDDLKEQSRLGNTGKNPRWAIAYKFAATKAMTRIKAITVQVGRTGVLTPVAELEPVFLAGSRISRATLHNVEEVQRKGFRIGDAVWIEKGGDVIPKVVSVDLSQRPHDSIPWAMPEICPACSTHVVHLEGEVAIRCPNHHGCPEQIEGRLRHFAGKDAMDIEHMGEKVIGQLVQKGFVKSFSDIYKLTEDELSKLSGFKKKSIENLLSSIERSKDVSLERFIMALGIKYVGAGTAALLAARGGSIQAICQMGEVELLQIEGVGAKVAESLLDYFGQSENRKELDRLIEAGVKPQEKLAPQFSSHPFQGKTFVLTGELAHYTRSTASSLIKERGGKVAGSVSKKTDYLLAGADPGSKMEKAKLVGIPILNEKEFIERL